MYLVTQEDPEDHHDLLRHVCKQFRDLPPRQLSEEDFSYRTLGDLGGKHLEALQLLCSSHVFAESAVATIERVIKRLQLLEGKYLVRAADCG